MIIAFLLAVSFLPLALVGISICKTGMRRYQPKFKPKILSQDDPPRLEHAEIIMLRLEEQRKSKLPTKKVLGKKKSRTKRSTKRK